MSGLRSREPPTPDRHSVQAGVRNDGRPGWTPMELCRWTQGPSGSVAESPTAWASRQSECPSASAEVFARLLDAAGVDQAPRQAVSAIASTQAPSRSATSRTLFSHWQRQPGFESRARAKRDPRDGVETAPEGWAPGRGPSISHPARPQRPIGPRSRFATFPRSRDRTRRPRRARLQAPRRDRRCTPPWSRKRPTGTESGRAFTMLVGLTGWFWNFVHDRADRGQRALGELWKCTIEHIDA